jgi:hypothetical protein
MNPPAVTCLLRASFNDAAEGPNALSETDQSTPSSLGSLRLIRTVVGDAQRRLSAVEAECHDDFGGVSSVPKCVRQRFLHNPVQGKLQRRVGREGTDDLEPHWKAGGPRPVD